MTTTTGFRRRALLGTTLGTTLAAGLGGLPLFAIRRAEAADHVLRFSNNVPATHPLNIRLREAAEAITAETQGKVELRVFPSNQLGADTDVLSQVRSGAVQMMTLSGLILSTLVPVAAINGVGFAFPDYPTVWKAMDGELGAHVRGEIAKAGLIAFDKIWDNGFRQITSASRPVTTPADLANFKIRVPVSPLWTSMFTAFGSAPTSINFAEVYSALQTRIVDGQENPLAVIETAKLYEVQKYCAMTNHMWDGFWLLANRRAFTSLPGPLRETVERILNAAALRQREDVAKLNQNLASQLSERGLVFNTPDPAPFRAKLAQAGFYGEWKGKFGPQAWGLLEAAVGGLA
ncbi:TRAP transporter substrate-binding protein [Roseomonas sp. GC11]|uniref:TRAP transporter substrate-binding protein n=1 Tax=Roseomonas sp. GC11 TaxID=2950546 RepID=UPI00210B49AF|nr:TRAP transporter substrate-binding protein [Roseomonas sp. GC11]MCQ4159353.1 TRAP transporter substrate-binding protein [Roseomonas sp. GC11]